MSHSAEGKWDQNAHFERAASSYERAGGGLTRLISDHLIRISEPPLSSTSVVLDNGCGPGITCTEILQVVPKEQWPAKIHATDFSPAMIREVDKKGHPEIEAAVMDAQDLKFPDAYFTHLYFAFAIFALPDSTKGTKEVYRTLQPGGTAYVTTWASVGWVPLVQRAIHAVRPEAPLYKNLLPEEWLTAEKLKDVLLSGGFEASKVTVQRFDASAGSEALDGTLEFMKSGILNPVTVGWSEQEKAQLHAECDKQVEEIRISGQKLQYPTWVGIARK